MGPLACGWYLVSSLPFTVALLLWTIPLILSVPELDTHLPESFPVALTVPVSFGAPSRPEFEQVGE